MPACQMRPDRAQPTEGEFSGTADAEVVRAAAHWMARMWSGQATAEDAAACSQWRGQRQEHELVWQRMQALGQRFCAVPDAAASQALKSAPEKLRRMRRKTLTLLGALLATGGLAALARRSESWQALAADYTSGVGQMRELRLSDGTQLVLNTNSAVDVVYTATARQVVLRFGEIMITTAHEDRPGVLAARPFTVLTREGEVRALGTRFTVRQFADSASVAVFEGAVQLRPDQQAGAGQRVEAGQQAAFTAQSASAPTALDPNAGNWQRGLLLVEQMPLAVLVAELGRYRHGVATCAPEVAELRVSGVFSVRDTDRALSSLTLGLPVQLQYRTSYWVSVIAAPAEK